MQSRKKIANYKKVAKRKQKWQIVFTKQNNYELKLLKRIAIFQKSRISAITFCCAAIKYQSITEHNLTMLNTYLGTKI